LVNRHVFTIINLDDLEGLAAQSEVTLSSLLEVGILTQDDGPLKVLGGGSVNVPLTVKAAAFTKSAKAAIEAAGGTCEVV